MSWRPTSASRAGTIVRLACSPVLWFPGAGLALAFVASGVIPGFLIAVAPTYLMWVWLVDIVTLVRSFWRPESYKARPRYWLFGLTSFLSLPIYWLCMWPDPDWHF
ncbi:MAG: hypothetical protein JWN04_6320 [Myxococcaceae bacterium]|nr:hypothetical protein [Myxococcaceae bacterium]